MRIVQAIFSTGFRGAERHVAELVNGLSQRHQVRLLLRADCGEGDPGKEASILPFLSRDVSVALLPPTLLGPALRWEIARFRPHIVHSHGGRAGRLSGWWGGGVPRLATMHLDYRRGWYRRQHALVAPTDWQAAMARAQGFSAPIHRLNLWVTPPPAPSPSRRQALRAAWGYPDAVRVIGAVGAFIPVKGFDVLIRAFRRLPEPSLRLLLVGDGPERAALAALAEGDARIRFAGFRPDVADLYPIFDLLAFPSRREPFGLVALEALAAGLPVAATRTQGSEAIFGAQADLAAPGDIPALEAALLRGLGEGRSALPPPDLTLYDRDRHLDALDGIYRAMRRE